jgi:hypothetical protein
MKNNKKEEIKKCPRDSRAGGIKKIHLLGWSLLYTVPSTN